MFLAVLHLRLLVVYHATSTTVHSETGKGLTHMDVTVGFLERRYIPGAAALDRLVLLLR